MENIMCHECKKSTRVVDDRNSGDSICTECGLVLESHFVDEKYDWRTFESDYFAKDPSRAECSRLSFPQNDTELFTTISKANGSIEQSTNKSSDIICLNEKHRFEKGNLIEGFEVISTMVDKLGLVKTIKDSAMEIYKKMKDCNSTHGRSNNVLATACLYNACRMENNPRTFKEIAAGATFFIEVGEISRTSKKIYKELQKNGDFAKMGGVDATSFVKRFCSKLQMDRNEVKVVSETITNLKKLDIRKKPMSMVAATIYMITQISKGKIVLADVSAATNVSKATILSTHKIISAFIPKIVPRWFLKANDFDKLPLAHSNFDTLEQ